jgi:anti-sigma regulatory factor (Ser/Thr protein kinase)
VTDSHGVPRAGEEGEFDQALVDAVRRAFLHPDGRPATTQVRLLTSAEAALLLSDEPAVRRVHAVDLAALALVLPDLDVTAALLVSTGPRASLVFTTDPIGRLQPNFAAALDAAAVPLAHALTGLRAEVAVVDALHTVGRQLTAQLDIDQIVQDATDAATTAVGAAFGAFFYNLINEYGESYTLYTISGVPREAFSRFPMPRNTAVFTPTFDGAATVRSPNIRADPRFGHNPPYYGMPKGHLPVCSYLAVSVISPTSGEVLGGFFFGHPQPDRFTERHEYLAEGIAGYAAIALDNARLFERERNLVTELTTSMLPVVPDVEGLDVVTRYLPAATGIKVGGDWFDVIRLPSGSTAFIIGDVVGHGVTAAAVMGQVRTAIRSYALLELAPSELLRNVSELTSALFELGFVTCFYAVHTPGEHRLTYANAGHPPGVLLCPDGSMELIGEALAKPLGVGSDFPERTAAFPPGSSLVLYTDGLVEARVRDLTVGTDHLLRALAEARNASDIGAGCDRMIAELTGGRHDDDIALIYVHNRAAAADFDQRIASTPQQASHVRDALDDWLAGQSIDADQRGDIVLASYEAIANAAEHAYRGSADGTVEVRGAANKNTISVTVIDHGAWKPADTAENLRGRGRNLMRALAHDVVTNQSNHGTTVTLTWRLGDIDTV